MAKRRLLVVGGSGLVGTNLVLAARAKWDVFATFYKHRVDFEDVEELALDIRDYQQASAIVRAVSPDVVVLASAFMDVDGCQKDPQTARETHAMGARHIAKVAGSDMALVYVSTDYVFDGNKGRPYSEQDAAAPVNVYGQTKLAGEEEVRAHAKEFTIVRPAQIWGENPFTHKPTLVQKVVSALQGGQEIQLVSDQVQSPTYAPELALDILALAHAEERGVFHAGGASAISRYEMGRQVARTWGLDEELVRPVKLKDAGLPAPRPLNVSLSRAKIEGAVGRRAPPFLDSLAQFKAGVAA
jgi:dTDP-4-dehydrorhamnose reductase